jgi:hypothetical protein
MKHQPGIVCMAVKMGFIGSISSCSAILVVREFNAAQCSRTARADFPAAER